MSRFTVLRVHLTTVVALGIAQSNCLFAQPQDDKPPVTVETTVEKTNVESEEKVPAESKSWKRYLVTVAEYRLKDIGPSELTTDGITAAIKEQKVSPVEAVMLSVAEGNGGSVSFGREVSVSNGKVTTRGGRTTRSMQRRDVGTILSVELMSAGDQVKAELSFSSSRHIGEATDDSPPELAATKIDTSQIFELGQPTLISASTGGGSSYVLLTITRH